MRFPISQFVLAGALLSATLPQLAALDAKPVILSPDRVASALQGFGVGAQSSEVEFVSAVPVSSSSSKLQVESWKRLNDSTAWVQLRCEKNQDCLPFFVLLHGAEHAFPAKQPVATGSMAHVSAKTAGRKPSLVRAGARATLFLLGASSRITTVVVCLDNGSLGSQVRVKNLVTKQILTAEVVDKGVVRSTF
jgi:Chaperone for flagella basal body P-ring formation